MNIIEKYLTRWMNMAMLVMLLATQNLAAEQALETVVGDAFRIDTNELLYREIHCEISALDREVIYQKPDGALIAYKLLDYRSGNTTPSFVQHNMQTKEKIKVSYDQAEISMSMTDADNKQTTDTHPATDKANQPIVIDAGFNRYIRDNWDALILGETKAFRFPVVSQSSLILLRIKSSVCSYKTEIDQCFTLEPSSWVFRMLAPSIELGYNPDTIQLIRYRGLSNISDESRKSFTVDIKYRHPSTPKTCNIDRQNLTDSIINI